MTGPVAPEGESALPVCVIGAGPCGLATAIAVERVGVPAVVFDRSCMCSSIASYPTFMTFFSLPDMFSDLQRKTK